MTPSDVKFSDFIKEETPKKDKKGFPVWLSCLLALGFWVFVILWAR
jgi:hypothetical protein